MAHRFPNNGQTLSGGRYDQTHRNARTRAAATHNPTDPCTRCGQPLGPMGRWLHYDHTDDGIGYLGFAHATCNVRAAAVASNRVQHARRTGTPPVTYRTTRDW